jgi:MYXO-CTERM domain-containing protein
MPIALPSFGPGGGWPVSRSQSLWLWLPVLVWLGIIFAFSAQPASGLPETGVLLRKGAHLGEYAVLAGLLWRALRGQGLAWNASAVLAWLGSTLYAASDELHQAIVPGRGPSPWDVLIDAAGAAVGLLALAVYWRLRRRDEHIPE